MAQLKPLQVLEAKLLGLWISALKSIYVSTIRSFTDYASPLHMKYSDAQLRKLELGQSEAMRIISRCTRTTRIEITRMELDIPSRIREFRPGSAVIRMLRKRDRLIRRL